MEKSYIWTCNEFGDGGPNSFSLEVIFTWLGTILTSHSPETAGVIPWKSTNTEIFNLLSLGNVSPTGELKPSYNSGTLTIDSGLGISGGIFYVNTSPKNFNIPALKSGYASATDRIVLRREVLAQTARLVYIQASSTFATAPIVQNNVYWDVPIARINLDGSGNYASFIDDREYTNAPSSSRVLLERRVLAANESSWDFTDISTIYANIEVEITGGTLIASVPSPAQFTPLEITINGIAASYETLETYYNTLSSTFEANYITGTNWKVRLPAGRVISSGIGIDNDFALKITLQNPTNISNALTPRTVGGEVFITKAYNARGIRSTLTNSATTGRISSLKLAVGTISGGIVTYIESGSIISLYGVK